MSQEVVMFGIYIFVISIVIYLVKNKEEILKLYNKFENKKIIKVILYFATILIILGSLLYSYNSLKTIIKNVKWYKISKENKMCFQLFDEKRKEENRVYNELIKKDYGDIEKEPYIPDNFQYVEGDIQIGYVIQDINGNQYVWVPCTNKDDENIVKLGKEDFYYWSGIKAYDCVDVKYKEFLESALNYGGFYVSRFESGKENDDVVSKHGVEILSNISRNEAIHIFENMYKNENLKCELINGYAYDTVLKWIKKNNNIERQKIDIINEEKIFTGRSKYNNIYDFTDNIMEITLEDSYDTIIYRGFDISEDIMQDSRYNVLEENVVNNNINKFTFRTIIYK